jgi:hypothetical protein
VTAAQQQQRQGGRSRAFPGQLESKQVEAVSALKRRALAEINTMKNGYATGVAAAIALSLATACSGTQSSQSFGPDTFSAGLSLFGNGVNPADTLPTCTAKSYSAPGTFRVLAALGEFSGSSFSSSGLSLWGTFTATRGRNRVPTIAPDLGGRYTIYYGTYKLGNGFVGCFYLAKVNHKGVSFNGAAAAWPKLRDYGKAIADEEGPLEISLRGISANAGSGTLTLKDPSGKTIGNGTVSIKGSKIIK